MTFFTSSPSKVSCSSSAWASYVSCYCTVVSREALLTLCNSSIFDFSRAWTLASPPLIILKGNTLVTLIRLTYNVLGNFILYLSFPLCAEVGKIFIVDGPKLGKAPRLSKHQQISYREKTVTYFDHGLSYIRCTFNVCTGTACNQIRSVDLQSAKDKADIL